VGGQYIGRLGANTVKTLTFENVEVHDPPAPTVAPPLSAIPSLAPLPSPG